MRAARSIAGRPFSIGTTRSTRYQELFIQPTWPETPHLVGFDEKTAANPFVVYAQIPPISRYRFLLDDSEYFIRTFIRGPVCKGQIALDVIHDHFWVFFREPDLDQTILEPGFLAEQSPNLVIPNEEGSNQRVVSTFSDTYREHYQAFYKAKTALYDRAMPGGFGLDSIWRGRRATDAPMLTVYRHFDSASVHKGALGALPRTAWVIDYTQFERIYYALVAGFDVFGNVSHQVNVRRYMDFLRVEGELNFVGFLPAADRLPKLQSWYLGDKAAEHAAAEEVLTVQGTRVDYQTNDPMRELIERIVDEHLLDSTQIDFDPINYRRSDTNETAMPTSFATHDDFLNGFRALTAQGTGFIRHHNEHDVNTLLVRLNGYEDEDRFFTIVVNRWHDNVNSLFGESERLDASKDAIDFLPGSIGSYPDFFLIVEAADLPGFFDMLANFDGSPRYAQLLAKFGVHRADARFWETYDWFQQRANEADPLNAGLYDLNRYYPVAPEG